MTFPMGLEELRALRARDPAGFRLAREEAAFADFVASLLVSEAEAPPGPEPGWRIGRRLGAGAYADVWAAEGPPAPIPVALKVYHPAAIPSAEEADRRLSRLFRDLPGPTRPSHPHLLGVFGGGETVDGRRFLVLERTTGATLRGVLNRLRRCASPRPDASWLEALPAAWGARGARRAQDPVLAYGEAVCTGMRQIASALWCCVDPETRRVHLRPEDVLLREDGSIAVNPISIEGWLRDVESYQLAACVDTAIYRGPWTIDQAGRDRDEASIAYALGSIAYELLTRRPAVPPQETWVLAKRAMRDHHPEPVEGVVAEFGASGYAPLRRVVAEALGKDPATIGHVSAFMGDLLGSAAPRQPRSEAGRDAALFPAAEAAPGSPAP